MDPEDSGMPSYVETVDDLPFGDSVPTGYIVNVGHPEAATQWIFDGFKWVAEGARPGEFLEHHRPQPEDTGFTHCSECVGTRVLTSMPPYIVYECEVCGGGNEVFNPVIELDPGQAGPAVEQHDSVLLEANRIINGERLAHYGDQYVNFGDIAALWSAYLDIPVNRYDVANLMIMLKLARTKRQGYHRDSYVDIGGYAGCAEKIHNAETQDGA